MGSLLPNINFFNINPQILNKVVKLPSQIAWKHAPPQKKINKN